LPATTVAAHPRATPDGVVLAIARLPAPGHPGVGPARKRPNKRAEQPVATAPWRSRDGHP